MANLITPDPRKHQYVVGIDFGHGETSAAICPLEWGKDAGHREANVIDLDMDIRARIKVIPSAICRVDNGLYIGEEAFEHMTDNNGIRVCFKQKPESIDGEAESLMVDYMTAVYRRIRENQDLTDTNHIVYIARPSGWQDEDAKELYRQMAIKAGIPLAGLTAESRAAIFYSRSPRVNFANDIAKGAIVFDLGSSTIDFTYLDDSGEAPVDNGANLGASKIDDAIYEEKILANADVAEFLQKYPEFDGALRFKARQFKEKAYGRRPDSPTRGDFMLSSILPETADAIIDEYGSVPVPLKISNLDELNQLIETKCQYISKLKKALMDFRANDIPNKTLNGVFLTGGASRMNFIEPLIAEALNLPIERVKRDSDNPSLTISRGIAMLGTMDAITHVLVGDLKKKIPALINEDKILNPLIDKLSFNIATAAWAQVEQSCNYWIKFGKTTDRDELKEQVQNGIMNFQNKELNKVVNDTFKSYVGEAAEQIRKSMNEIISRYAPGREITSNKSISLGNQQAIADSLQDMSSMIAAICDSINHIIADILWKALAVFLWGVFALPYYILKAVFTSDESKRRDKAKEILDKKIEIIGNVKGAIRDNLKKNNVFRKSVSTTLNGYFNDMIDSNLKKVIIPIE